MVNPVGIFDKTMVAEGWFDETLQSKGWYDNYLIALTTVDSGTTMAFGYYLRYMGGL